MRSTANLESELHAALPRAARGVMVRIVLVHGSSPMRTPRIPPPNSEPKRAGISERGTGKWARQADMPFRCDGLPERVPNLACPTWPITIERVSHFPAGLTHGGYTCRVTTGERG